MTTYDLSLDLMKDKELFVLDMDGTIYLGETVFDHAVEFVSAVKAKGKKIMYFTNNASKDPGFYYNKLIRMGFEADREEIVTAGDVTAEFLIKNHPGEPVYLVGTPELEQNFIKRGIILSEEANIVVSSFDTTLTYRKLEIACHLIRNGAIFYSTHPDFNCPVENGFIPDSGAICALITASTDKQPRYFGKPHKETAEIISAVSRIDFDHMVMVGDRLYTDIALGKNNGITSVLVLSGETKIGDITPENQPDFVIDKLGDLIPHL